MKVTIKGTDVGTIMVIQRANWALWIMNVPAGLIKGIVVSEFMCVGVHVRIQSEIIQKIL